MNTVPLVFDTWAISLLVTANGIKLHRQSGSILLMPMDANALCKRHLRCVVVRPWNDISITESYVVASSWAAERTWASSPYSPSCHQRKSRTFQSAHRQCEAAAVLFLLPDKECPGVAKSTEVFF